ncbi:zinc finger protein 26-like [Mya arenaria]|uniref:zinc finger protein 26-like n=1 Tax=Mya arenaria TaxID=6604 RepID=UPI0022E53BFA|nr:zinc finger protein 26-like [Mya arenaria]
MMEVLERPGHPTDLQAFLYRLYQEHALCDFQVTSTRDGKVFHAHRAVLSATSQYIHSQSVPNMGKTSVEVDACSDAVGSVLEFCYTGQLYVSADQWEPVYSVASCLQVYAALELMKQKLAGNLDFPLGASTIDVQNDSPDTGGDAKGDNLDYHELDNLTSQILDLENSAGLQTEAHDVDPVHEIFPSNDSSVIGSNNSYITSNLSKQGGNVNVTCGKRSRSGFGGQDDNNDPNYDPSVDSKNGKSARKLNHSNKVITKSGRQKQKKCDDYLEDIHQTVFEIGADESQNRNGSSNKPGTIFLTIRTKQQKKANDQNWLKCVPGGHKEKVPELKQLNGIPEGLNERKIFIPSKNNCSCSICDKHFVSFFSLNRHQLFYHNKLFRRVKAHILKSQSLFDRGWRNIKKIRKSEKKIYLCTICNRSFTKYEFARFHINNKHCKDRKCLTSFIGVHNKIIQILKDSVKLAKNRKALNKVNEQFTTLQSRVKRSYQRRKTDKSVLCKKCGRKFATNMSMQAHLKHIHGVVQSKNGQYVQWSKPGVRTSGQNGDRTRGLFRCVDCGLSLSSDLTLVKHLEVRHGYSHSKAVARQHLLSTPVMCDVKACTYSTGSLEEMSAHVIETHPFLKYVCSICNHVFRVRLQLERHVHSCERRKSHQCRYCPKTFPRRAVARTHEHWVHGATYDKIKVYACDHPGCDYKAHNSSGLKNHQSKHRKDKQFTCQYCGLKLKTATTHERHVQGVHMGVRPFLCQICGVSFHEEAHLKAHTNCKHAAEQLYVCKHCGYTTPVKCTYQTHMFNVHKERAEGDKREVLQCPHCPYTAILLYRFNTHLNTHTDARTFFCAPCKRGFNSAGALRSHKEWMHSDKIYSCNQCAYETKASKKLNEHVRVQHQLKGFKPYRCPYCSFTCATGGNTRKHVKQVHKGQPVTYIRDTDLLIAARKARAAGHYSSIEDYMDPAGSGPPNLKQGLTDNQLHIVM